MADTTNLRLPLMTAAQAQKHVTHNEALLGLDALAQLAVTDRTTATPPASPAEGDRYIVAASPTGAWTGKAGYVAAWQDGLWRFYQPLPGWLAYCRAESALLIWSGTAWVALPGGSSGGSFTSLGVNATADATNRVAISAANVLVTDEGAGVQVKVNKTGSGTTGSYLFQTGYSGRAEFGLIGGDDFKLKVSPNGSSWTDALSVNRTTGAATMVSLALTTDLAVADGGTGASTAAAARTNLGLGTMATQAANAVAITGGTAALTSVSASSFAAVGGATASFPTIYFDGAASTSRQMIGSTAGVNRWQLNFGDATPESGSNSGSNFSLRRFSDAGAAIDFPLSVDRATGKTTLTALAVTGAIEAGGQTIADANGLTRRKAYTVGTLPTAGTAGRGAFATNGRAFNGAGTLEGAGAGTGVEVSDNGSAWKVVGTNQTVQA